MSKILVCGVYLTDRESCVTEAVAAFEASALHAVTQRWIALGPAAADPVPHTVRQVGERAPKYALLNTLLADADDFDWVIACDDDVEFPDGFVDRFFEHAVRHDFALCQPARTLESYIDHAITGQIEGIAARRTRFVEIGPVTVIRRDAVPLLLPFPDNEGMGWGLDLVWPAILEAAGFTMGIVDAAPIHHRLRPSVVNYSYADAEKRMGELIGSLPHITRDDAYRVLETFP